MLIIRNRDARRLWLHVQGLSKPPTGTLNLSELISELGFVQLDTIRVVARAHDHILWSRNQNFRPHMLEKCLAADRQIFEHFTHDASLLPMETYPYWQRQFKRMEEKVRGWEWHHGMPDEDGRNLIRQRIADEGALCTKAFDSKIVGRRQMWRRPPHKLALDYMWYAGDLTTSHRENFNKFYDLAERVIPKDIRKKKISDDAQIKWLCKNAMHRLAFATPSEIQRFWDAVDLAEAKTWAHNSRNNLVPVKVEHADGTLRDCFARPDIEILLETVPSPTTRLRILNPFDPAIRDRIRLKRLFGFDYKIEIFIPAAKRQWGYYVYPILEGDRLVGRIEVRANRKEYILEVVKLWPEGSVAWSPARAKKLDAELHRMKRFINLDNIVWL